MHPDTGISKNVISITWIYWLTISSNENIKEAWNGPSTKFYILDIHTMDNPSFDKSWKIDCYLKSLKDFSKRNRVLWFNVSMLFCLSPMITWRWAYSDIFDEPYLIKTPWYEAFLLYMFCFCKCTFLQNYFVGFEIIHYQ